VTELLGEVLSYDPSGVREDTELIESYKNGDTEAFGKLFEKYKHFVYNCCIKALKNPEDAEDVSQNVWVHFSAYLFQFKEDCSVRTILFRISKDRSIDYIRQKDTRSEEEQYSPEDLKELYAYSKESPDQDLLVNDMLKSLEPEEKALVIAMVFEGHTGEEDDLAGKLGVARSTVSRRLDRALEKLRGEING